MKILLKRNVVMRKLWWLLFGFVAAWIASLYVTSWVLFSLLRDAAIWWAVPTVFTTLLCQAFFSLVMGMCAYEVIEKIDEIRKARK